MSVEWSAVRDPSPAHCTRVARLAPANPFYSAAYVRARRTLGCESFLLARVRGFSRARSILREALQNALVPTVTLTGVQFTVLIGGTVLIERIFNQSDSIVD